MPQASAFVPAAALPARRAAPARLSRRARAPAVACARAPDGDDAWMDMAKKLERGRPLGRAFGFGSEPEPVRGEPEWVFPEGEDFSTPPEGAGGAEAPDDVLDDPWATWRKAQEAAPKGADGRVEGEGRDSKAETDFWRKAVAEVVEGVTGGGAAEDGAAGGGAGGGEGAGREEDILEALPSDPKELWGKASRVTADVADLQESLREEIAGFNPLQQSDAYRDIARELVGPSGPDVADGEGLEAREDAVGGDGELGRARDDFSAEDAAAGTGWNPDVDWKRYDDINRELQLKSEASLRADVQSEAERMRDDALASGGLPGDQPPAQSYLDADGRVMSDEEVAEALAAGAVIIDEAGNEMPGGPVSPDGFGTPQLPLPETPPPVAEIGVAPTVAFNPGVKAARRRGGRTYGADALDAEEEMAWLEERGFSRRDPEQEKAFWRDAAREIGMAPAGDADASPEDELSEAEVESAPVGDILGEDVENELEKPAEVEVQKELTEAYLGETSPAQQGMVESPVELAPDEEDLNVDSSSAWGLWNSSSESWAKEVDNAPPRDAAAEVDMWRSTANEIVPDGTNVDGRSQGTTEGSPVSDGSSSSPGNAWDAWNSASDSWKTDFENSDATFSSVNPGDQWLDSARSVAESAGADFAAGPGKSASPGSADSRPPEKASWDSGAPSSAWSTWQNSSTFGESGGFGASTWSTRSDVVSNKKSQASAGDDMSMWTSAAREMGSGTTASDNAESSADAGKSARPVSSRSDASGDASTSNIDMWKAAAREVQLPKEAAGDTGSPKEGEE